jgi:hypothetical protein
LQCFYYRGFTWHDEVVPPKPTNYLGEANERTGLLAPTIDRERRSSTVSASHLSPVVPLLDAPKPSDPPSIANAKPTTRLQATLFNLIAILMVCAAGVLGWYVSNRSQGGHSSKKPSSSDDILSFNLWGQIFGYFCAVLYLGSRVPQILLNYRRKSTEGVSMLFFLFACIGNLTYVLSIFAYEPHCRDKHGRCREGEAVAVYGQYIAVNASWLAGSLGTLFLDLGIFAQFFLYRDQDEDGFDESAVENGVTREERGERDQRPLLNRGDSEY